MSAQAQQLLTPEQYLEIERAAEFKSEYYCGHVYAMAGASPAHVFMTANLIVELGQAMKGKPCRLASSDLRLRVSPHGLYTYPDVIVICGQPLFADDQTDTLLNPTLLIEILSKSTEGYDRGFKFAQYRKLESLREYVLVSQDEPRVEKFIRRSEGEWLFSECAGLNATCRFESLGCDIAMADIYMNIAFSFAQQLSLPL